MPTEVLEPTAPPAATPQEPRTVHCTLIQVQFPPTVRLTRIRERATWAEPIVPEPRPLRTITEQAVLRAARWATEGMELEGVSAERDRDRIYATATDPRTGVRIPLFGVGSQGETTPSHRGLPQWRVQSLVDAATLDTVQERALVPLDRKVRRLATLMAGHIQAVPAYGYHRPFQLAVTSSMQQWFLRLCDDDSSRHDAALVAASVEGRCLVQVQLPITRRTDLDTSAATQLQGWANLEVAMANRRRPITSTAARKEEWMGLWVARLTPVISTLQQLAVVYDRLGPDVCTMFEVKGWELLNVFRSEYTLLRRSLRLPSQACPF